MNKDVERFMDGVPAELKSHYDTLHELILSMYPDADVVISYGWGFALY